VGCYTLFLGFSFCYTFQSRFCRPANTYAAEGVGCRGMMTPNAAPCCFPYCFINMAENDPLVFPWQQKNLVKKSGQVMIYDDTET